MTQSTVAVVRCTSYDPESVYHALARGIEQLGGLDRLVRPGERILLKPNILAGEPPEKAVTTHPAVLAACIRLLRRGGASVSFGDSPGIENAAHAARHSELLEAGLQEGATLAEFGASSPLANAGQVVPHWPVAQAIHEADGLINLPKMKTHQLTRITGAVKNLFGCISGKRKALYHVQFPDITAFSTLLVELARCLQPRLHILDGIVAMEGSGPRGGDPRDMGVLVMSTDPIAVDATFCRLVDMDPAYVPTNEIGRELGLGCYDLDEIAYVGDPWQEWVQPTFRMVRKPVYSNASYAYYGLIKRLLLPRPAIDPARCIRCGRCVEACPVPDKALRFAVDSTAHRADRRQPPVYDYGRCIRCYCCQEMCPHRAIEQKTPLLGRVAQFG